MRERNINTWRKTQGTSENHQPFRNKPDSCLYLTPFFSALYIVKIKVGSLQYLCFIYFSHHISLLWYFKNHCQLICNWEKKEIPDGSWGACLCKAFPGWTAGTQLSGECAGQGNCRLRLSTEAKRQCLNSAWVEEGKDSLRGLEESSEAKFTGWTRRQLLKLQS